MGQVNKMDDLISRQAAIDVADAVWSVTGDKNVAKVWDQIKDLPSAQPEIIRCKDCRYYRWEIDMCDYPYATAQNVVHEDDFCSKAERKEHE